MIIMIYHDTGFGWFWATSSYTFSKCLRCSWSFLWEMRGMGPPNQTILEENNANRGQPEVPWKTMNFKLVTTYHYMSSFINYNSIIHSYLIFEIQKIHFWRKIVSDNLVVGPCWVKLRV